VSQATVVTCLFDLSSRESPSARPTLARYLEWGQFLLSLEANLVCFCEPSIEPVITARREQGSPLKRTCVIPCPLESLSSYQLLDRARHARQEHPLLNGDPGKDTPLSAVLGWSKLELLERVVQLNPFGSEHFIWTDFGLAKVARTDHYREDRVFTNPPDAVRLQQLYPLDASLLNDRARHLSYWRGHFAAGLISGRAERLRGLCLTMRRELEDALAAGFAPLEEQLLELAVARQPELFDLYHGDYEHIIENYRQPRGAAGNLLSQLRAWRSRGEWQSAARLADSIIVAVETATFRARPDELAPLLDECFLIAYYAHEPDQGEAQAAANLYLEWASRDPEFRDEFLRQEVRVRTNFSFLREGA
jgi:hypothetical protein